MPLSAHAQSCAAAAVAAMSGPAQGSAMLIGPSGLTRTLVLQAVTDQMRRQGGQVVAVQCHAQTRLGLRGFMARLVDLPDTQQLEARQIEQAFGRLTRGGAGSPMTVLVVDGVEALSVAVFRYIQLALRSSASLRVLLVGEGPIAALLDPAFDVLRGQITVVLQPERMETPDRDLAFSRHFTLDTTPFDRLQAVVAPMDAPVNPVPAPPLTPVPKGRSRRVPVAWAMVGAVMLASLAASQWPPHDHLTPAAPAAPATATTDALVEPSSPAPNSVAAIDPGPAVPAAVEAGPVADATLATADPPAPGIAPVAEPEVPPVTATAPFMPVADLPQTAAPETPPAVPSVAPAETARQADPPLAPAVTAEPIPTHAPPRLAAIAARPRPAPPAPASPVPVHAAQRKATPDQRCRDIVLKVQLGEDPSRDDTQYLRDGCH